MTVGELATWRALVDTTGELRRILGAQLLQETGLSPADYQVLLALSEVAGRRLRSSELAATIDWGHSGAVIERIETDGGFRVNIAASGGQERITRITEILAKGARPHWVVDDVRDADIVVLAIPLHRFAAFDPALVAGKLVVDAMNY